MDQTTANILNQVFGIYNGSIVNLEAGSIKIAKEIYYTIGTISLAMFGFGLLLKKGQDLADTHLDLIKQLIYLIFLYAFIDNFSNIFTAVFTWIQDIGNYLGIQASHASINTQVMSINPINIFSIGVDVAKKMLIIPVDWNLVNDLLVAIFAVISAAAVLFCFAVIGLELILVQIGSQIILAGGVFLLGFAALPWAREYAEKYVHTFFHVGIKMIFIYILVGIGMSLSQNWKTVLAQSNKDQIIATYMAVAVASYVYYKVCIKLPDQAVSWLTGRMAMGFDAASDVKAGIKTAAAIPANAVGAAAAVSGMGAAVGAANQLAKAQLADRGVKATALNIGTETVKTLGSAIKQEQWGKKVDSTFGGKIAKTMTGGVADIAGEAKARDAATQAANTKFSAEGKQGSPQEIQNQASSILSDARWNKTVDATDGGELAKKIIENTAKEYPQPKTRKKKEPPTNVTDDYTI